MDELTIAFVSLAAAAGAALVTTRDYLARVRRKREVRSAIDELAVRRGANIPDLWRTFEPKQTYLDTESRAVLRGDLGSLGECIVKISVSSRGGPAESFGIFREAFVLNWLAGRGAPRLLGLTNSPDGRSAAIAMTAAPGLPLSRAMTKTGPPSIGDVHLLVAGVCERVIALHTAGFVHGDLKPSNLIAEWAPGESGRITLRPASEIVIVDYESASLLSQATEKGSSTSHGVVRGTQGFTAPERFYRFDSSPEVDVYSCGVLAGFLLTLAPRRPGTSARDRIAIRGWRDLIVRSTDRNPERRPASVEEFRSTWSSVFRELSKDEQLSRVDWPARASEKLVGLEEAGVLMSVLESQTVYPGSAVVWELDEVLRVLSAAERQRFESWQEHGTESVKFTEIEPILRKLELTFFDRVRRDHPELSTMLSLDTANRHP